MGWQSQLSIHDILPFVNQMWVSSFACKDYNMKEIRDRRWNPLNYMLLTDPEVLKAKVENSTPSTTSPIIIPSLHFVKGMAGIFTTDLV
eukprot:14703835-Ditylum_brightwellii.AAC.1